MTSIDVGTTTPEFEKLMGSPAVAAPAASAAPAAAGAATLSFFDQAPAAAATPAAATTASPDERRVTVVQRKLSAFVVQIDYLSLPEEKAPAGTEGEPKK